MWRGSLDYIWKERKCFSRLDGNAGKLFNEGHISNCATSGPKTSQPKDPWWVQVGRLIEGEPGYKWFEIDARLEPEELEWASYTERWFQEGDLECRRVKLRKRSIKGVQIKHPTSYDANCDCNCQDWTIVSFSPTETLVSMRRPSKKMKVPSGMGGFGADYWGSKPFLIVRAAAWRGNDVKTSS